MNGNGHRAPRMDRQTAGELAQVMSVYADDSKKRRLKVAPARVTKSATDGSGRFSALVSTFGPPPDSQGDIVSPGAFLLSIADWRARGRMPSIWWGHEYQNPSAAIGVIKSMHETNEGLVIDGQLDLDHEPAVAVYEGLLSGRLSEFSISFAIVSEHTEKSAEFGEYRVLDALELLEVSVVWAGANRFTRLIDIKNTTSSSDGSVTWTSTPISEIDRLNAKLSALASPQRKSAAPDLVDGFVREDRELRQREEGERQRLDGLERNLRNRAMWMALDEPAAEADPVLKDLKDQLDALERPVRKAADVDAQIEALRIEVQQELVQERLDRERATSTNPPVKHRLVLAPDMTEMSPMRERIDVQVTQVGESVGRLELDIPDGLPDEVEMLKREVERLRRENAALLQEVARGRTPSAAKRPAIGADERPQHLEG